MIAGEAEKWLGYLEHADGRLLGAFTANAGKGYRTIFDRIIAENGGGDWSGFAWCALFVYAMFIRALGADRAGELLGSPVPGTRVLERRMKRKGLWRGREYIPRRNDIVFMSTKASDKVNHVGIVERVYDSGAFVTIDGNTVDETGFFMPEEGGAVGRRLRVSEDKRIIGYAQTSIYL